MSKTAIGFVGLGLMGKPMARRFLEAGYPLAVSSRSRPPVDEVAAEGARACGSPRRGGGAFGSRLHHAARRPEPERRGLFGKRAFSSHEARRRACGLHEQRPGLLRRGRRSAVRKGSRDARRPGIGRAGGRGAGRARHHGRRPQRRLRALQAPCSTCSGRRWCTWARRRRARGCIAKLANQILVAVTFLGRGRGARVRCQGRPRPRGPGGRDGGGVSRAAGGWRSRRRKSSRAISLPAGR